MFGLIAYIASGPHLRSPWLRLLIAAPACLIPLGYTQANNDLATTQFVALYGIFWLLLWRPGTRAGQLAAPVIMLGTTLSSILPAAVRAAGRGPADGRPVEGTRWPSPCAGRRAWLAQWSGSAARDERPARPRVDQPALDPRELRDRVVPRALFGEHALGGPGTNGDGHPLPLVIPDMAVHTALIWGAWGLSPWPSSSRLTRLTAPHWALAVTALLSSVLLFVGEIVNNLPIVQPRYVIAPALLLYTAIIAALRPRGVPDGRAGRGGGPFAGLDPGRRVRPRAGRGLRIQLPGARTTARRARPGQRWSRRRRGSA